MASLQAATRKNGDEVRETMTAFWRAHSKDANLDEMMLDSNAEQLNKIEMAEILEMVPDFNGKQILELGAGIGRYTTEFCKQASNVVAVDFMASFVEKNRENNKNFDNLRLICADVMNLQFEENSFDVIFSNWLFMYLNDSDISTLVSRMLHWLKPDGRFFLRESCNRPSGNLKRVDNPTFYRTQHEYSKLMTSSPSSNDVIMRRRFEIIWSKPIETYIKYKNNENQICWLLDSQQRSDDDGKSLQQILDEIKFDNKLIGFYERLYGSRSVDCGTRIVNDRMAALLSGTVTAASTVLDVGCALGGTSTLLAEKFDCKVTAIDLSANLIAIARQRARESRQRDKLHFQMADVRKIELTDEHYDVIYAQDALSYNHNKTHIFTKISHWMKKDGKFFLVDYCCREGEGGSSKSTEEGYLYSSSQYEKMLREMGFGRVKCTDLTLEMKTALQKTLEGFDWLASTGSIDMDQARDEEKTKIEKRIINLNNGSLQWKIFEASK